MERIYTFRRVYFSFRGVKLYYNNQGLTPDLIRFDPRPDEVHPGRPTASRYDICVKLPE
jgi:hypothetical protein